MKIKRSPRIASFFFWYTKRLLNKRFEGVALSLDSVAAFEAMCRTPQAIVYSTHSSWWDVMLGFYIAGATGLALFAPMDPDQLKKYRILERIGLFPASEERPRNFIKMLALIFAMKERSGLWITPQAEFTPNTRPNPQFKRGLDLAIRRHPDAALFAISIDYTFWNESNPVVTVAIRSVDQHESANREQRLRQELDDQTSALLARSANRNPAEWMWLLQAKPRTVPIQDLALKLRSVGSSSNIQRGHQR